MFNYPKYGDEVQRLSNEIWIKHDMGKLREWNWGWKADPDLSQYSAELFGPVKLIYTEESRKQLSSLNLLQLISY